MPRARVTDAVTNADIICDTIKHALSIVYAVAVAHSDCLQDPVAVVHANPNKNSNKFKIALQDPIADAFINALPARRSEGWL